MENVNIKNLGVYQGRYLFGVEIGSSKHRITLSRDYWLKLSNGNEPPAQLILDSMMFLLSREPEEKILKEFDLEDIKKYFPDYEEVIGKK